MSFYSKWTSIGYPRVKNKPETEPNRFRGSELENLLKYTPVGMLNLDVDTLCFISIAV